MQLFEMFSESTLLANIFNSYKNGHMPHALLFLSIDEFTNINFSKLVASRIICESADDYAKFVKGTHPDVKFYPMAKQNISVLDISDIYENIQIKPMIAKCKIFVLNNFDIATEQAQNKLLKILEEPPKNVFFILNGTNENKILSTIISRVQKRYIPKPTQKEVVEQLNYLFKENKYESNYICEQSDASFAEAYEISDGYIGGAIDVVCNKEYRENYKFVQNFINNCKKSTDVLDFVNNFNKNNFEEILFLFSKAYRAKLIATLLQRASAEYSCEALVKIIQLLNNYKKMFESNTSVSALAENLLLKIMEIKNLCK